MPPCLDDTSFKNDKQTYHEKVLKVQSSFFYIKAVAIPWTNLKKQWRMDHLRVTLTQLKNLSWRNLKNKRNRREVQWKIYHKAIICQHFPWQSRQKDQGLVLVLTTKSAVTHDWTQGFLIWLKGDWNILITSEFQ